MLNDVDDVARACVATAVALASEYFCPRCPSILCEFLENLSHLY